MRITVHTVVLILLAAAAMQTWLVDGLATPCRIVGSSMAETLLGAHREVVCGDCGFRFSCGVDVSPAPTRAVCPNCGYAANNVDSLLDRDGDRVLIDRAAFAIRAPRRWEVAAFRRRSSANRILVKRVVGLPGESIEIRQGDVFADGRIQRKSLAQQCALAILVHDADFRPKHESTLPQRWRSERSDSRWNAVDGCFSHAAASDERIDWLAYHHWRRLATGGAGESAVTDICGYNQSQPRREEDVQAVTDLMLSFRLGPVSDRGAILIRMSDGSRGFQTRLQFGSRGAECATACLQTAPGQPVTLGTAGEPPVAHCTVPASNAERLVNVSLIDQQFLLAIDGRTVMVWPYERSEPARIPLTCPLAIGAEGIPVTIRGLRVYRDTHYTQPIAPPGRKPGDRPVHLADGEYFVLGDNSPTSDDSRTWPEPRAVDAKLLVGKPLVAVPSLPLSFGGRWHFQVPNPLQIRYIR